MGKKEEAIDNLYEKAGDPEIGQTKFDQVLQRIKALLSLEH